MGFGPYFEIPHRIDERDALVTMRPPKDGDAAEMARLMQDFTVQQFLFLQGGMTEKDEEDFFERCRTSREHVLWAISVAYEDQPEELVGVTSLHRQRSTRAGPG